MIGVKEQLYQYCVELLNERVETAHEAIRIAQQSANDETKSSAGDKYETGRAMMQLEVEQNLVQLHEALRQKEMLESINFTQQAIAVQVGSLVVTESDSFFVAISIGLKPFRGNQYAIISPSTPIGKSIMGLKVGESFSFRGRLLTILEIL